MISLNNFIFFYIFIPTTIIMKFTNIKHFKITLINKKKIQCEAKVAV